MSDKPKRYTFEQCTEKAFGHADTLKASNETINKICNTFFSANQPYIEWLEAENKEYKLIEQNYDSLKQVFKKLEANYIKLLWHEHFYKTAQLILAKTDFKYMETITTLREALEEIIKEDEPMDYTCGTIAEEALKKLEQE